MAFHAPSIDPVILTLGHFSVRWYGLSYFAGLILGYFYIKRIIRIHKINFPPIQIDNFFSWAAFAIILGGRLSYVIFYEPKRYLSDPIEILKIYEGGMSFHGGAIILLLATYHFCKKNSLEWKSLVDLLAAAAPITITLGRIANFINNELYGRVTNVPWAVIFPYTDNCPRHPSQLYEALLEGVFLFFILNVLIRRYKTSKGLTGGVFFIGYAFMRIVAECFREPDTQIGFLAKHLTLGQLLSIPLFMIGCAIIYLSFRDTNRANEYLNKAQSSK